MTARKKTRRRKFSTVIRVSERVRRAIERERTKNETPNDVLRRTLKIDGDARPPFVVTGSTVIRIDADVWRAIVKSRTSRSETPNDVLERFI